MVNRQASVPGYCCWLAVASLAAVCLPAIGQSDRPAHAKSGSFPQAAELRSLDGLTIVPTWSETGKRANDSLVCVRSARSRATGSEYIEFDIRLRSLPSRSEGPDDDRAGADPREVRLRSARLMLAGAALTACPRFEHWFDNPGGQSSDISLPGLPGRALYTEATREYTPGRQGPAHFQSRCLIRISIDSLDEALAKTVRKQPAAPSGLSLRLVTEAGELIVPLQGTPRTATAPAEGAIPQEREAALRGDSAEHHPSNHTWN